MFEIDTYWKLVEYRAQHTPNSIMLLEPSGRRLTFSDYKLEAEALATVLSRCGIREGDWVTWQLKTGIQAAILIAALARLGAVQNPLIHLYREREVSQILGQNQSDFFITTGDEEIMNTNLAATLQGRTDKKYPQLLRLDDIGGAGQEAGISTLPPFEPKPNIVRWIFYTSGTTAEPKGVKHLDYSILSAGRGLAESYALTASDIGCLAFPIAHIGGPMYLAEILYSGASALLLDKFKGPDVVETLEHFKVTACGGSTAHYQVLLEERRSSVAKTFLPDLKVVGGGGAPKPPELFYQCKSEIGFTISHSYGMTECPCVTVSPVDSNDEQLASTDGVAQPDVEIRIVAANEAIVVSPGVEGEIRIRGKGVCMGYTKTNLNKTAFDNDGFFCTGDIGSLQSDGRLVISGRLKDIIIRKGENISEREIEELLSGHPRIGAVAVIGVPDTRSGERVCAVVELRDKSKPLVFSEMVRFLKSSGLMRQKIPEQLEIVDQLPRNETFQKVLKQELRNWFKEY